MDYHDAAADAADRERDRLAVEGPQREGPTGIFVQGQWHEPYIKGFCVGCKQFDRFLSEVKPSRWRCDPCRAKEESHAL